MLPESRTAFIESEINQYANDVRCLFDTLVSQGFDETEAFQILLVTLKNSK